MFKLEKTFKGCKFILQATNEPKMYDYGDLTLTIEKMGWKKTLPIKHDFEYYIKLQKTQIKSSDILDFFEKIGNTKELYIASGFAEKMIKMYM